MKNKSSLIEKMFLVLFVILLVLVIVQQTGSINQTVSRSTPEGSVRYYFEAWNNKSYDVMYNAISDGFKKVEPTAANLSEFTKLINSSDVNRVDILLINTTSNDGFSANVDFDVIYYINNVPAPSKSNFLLIYRSDDRVPGWKIIQPYGAKVESS